MEQVYGKKVESYHDSTDNYIAENEVTIRKDICVLN